MNLRSHAQVLDFFGDFTLVGPGLVPVPEWRPDEPAVPGTPPIGVYDGVAGKVG